MTIIRPSLFGHSRPARRPVADAAKVCALGSELAQAHWRIQSIGIEPLIGAPGRFTAQTPTGEHVTVYETHRLRTAADRFAAALGALARDPWPHMALTEVCDHLAAQGHPVVVEPVRLRFDQIPSLPAFAQPRPALTAAYWCARALVHNRWCLSQFGQDLAQGGYVAEVPDGAVIVVPADVIDDGTPVTALARLIPELTEREYWQLAELVSADSTPKRVAPKEFRWSVMRWKVTTRLRRLIGH